MSKSKFLPSLFLVNRAAPISVSLAFGPHSYASTVNATVGAGHLVPLPVHQSLNVRGMKLTATEAL